MFVAPLLRYSHLVISSQAEFFGGLVSVVALAMLTEAISCIRREG
jgi:hypothetical protein